MAGLTASAHSQSRFGPSYASAPFGCGTRSVPPVRERTFTQSSPPASADATAGRFASATSEHKTALMPAPAIQPGC